MFVLIGVGVVIVSVLGGYVAGLFLCGPFDGLRPRNVGEPLDH